MAFRLNSIRSTFALFENRIGSRRATPFLPCACCNPVSQKLFARIEKGLSRRSILKGIAASLVAPAAGLNGMAFAQSSGKPIRLKNARIFDSVGSALIDGRDVLVHDGRIKRSEERRVGEAWRARGARGGETRRGKEQREQR